MAKSKCSKYGQRKLSLVQKVILAYLADNEDERCRIDELSWYVARVFNLEQGDRIWNARKQKEKLLEDFQKEKDEEVKHRKGKAAMLAFRLIDSCHRKKEILTEKHRASFSRSLSRLHDRGLVDLYGYGWRTTRVGLTGRGRKAAEVIEFRNG